MCNKCYRCKSYARTNISIPLAMLREQDAFFPQIKKDSWDSFVLNVLPL